MGSLTYRIRLIGGHGLISARLSFAILRFAILISQFLISQFLNLAIQSLRGMTHIVCAPFKIEFIAFEQYWVELNIQIV